VQLPGPDELDRQRTVLKIDTSNEEFYRCYKQGVQDMAAPRPTAAAAGATMADDSEGP